MRHLISRLVWEKNIKTCYDIETPSIHGFYRLRGDISRFNCYITAISCFLYFRRSLLSNFKIFIKPNVNELFNLIRTVSPFSKILRGNLEIISLDIRCLRLVTNTITSNKTLAYPVNSHVKILPFSFCHFHLVLNSNNAIA